MKKKILSLILVAMIAVSACAFSACDEIEKGNKIQRVIITLNFCDAEGKVIDTKKVQAKLYTNYAPEACARFLQLAEDGYFDGVCIANVQTNWLEFGNYYYDENGVLTAKTFDSNKYGTLKGEFLKNGWVGNELKRQEGSLIFKHDETSTGSVSKYDTAKGTIVISLGNINKFNEEEYCVFGMICADDIDDNPYSALDDSSLTNRSGRTSINVVNTIKNLTSVDGVRTYYYVPDDAYYTRYTDEEGTTRYYHGTDYTNEEMELTAEEKSDFINLIDGSDADLLIVPCTKVIVESIKKK